MLVDVDPLDVCQQVQRSAHVGATSFRLLKEDSRVALLREAEGYAYQPEEEIVGSGDRIVRQQLCSFSSFPPQSQFIQLRDSFQALLDRALALARSQTDWEVAAAAEAGSSGPSTSGSTKIGLNPSDLQNLFQSPHLFETPLSFNSMVLQRYEKGSLGITPHKDGLSYINLISIFVIGGRGRFYLCSDRSGAGAIEIDASPGNVILMRAPGLMGTGSKERPFHYVTDIEETRYTFGLRQKAGSQ